MNDIVASAHSAREKLAAALALLQAPEAESLVDSVAEPVARAMGALHRIEKSSGESLVESGPIALTAVREALAALQTIEVGDVAERATEQVAGSLGLVHSLARQAEALVAQKTATNSPSEAPAKNPGLDRTTPSVAPPEKHEPDTSTAAFDKTIIGGSSADLGFDKTQAQPIASPVAHLETPSRETRRSDRPEVKHAPSIDGPSSGETIIEANLGAHSPTNFYKGLSGNDVIDDGGLFVATYNIPPIGSTIWLKVTMPGGYDFEARGEVRWSRESGASDAPPGFGAALQAVSPEGKELIYRYVRNREPLFHDDF